MGSIVDDKCTLLEATQNAGKTRMKESFLYDDKFYLQGQGSESFLADDVHHYKAIRLFDTYSGADIGLEMTSVDLSDEHEYLNRFLNRKIRITIEAID